MSIDSLEFIGFNFILEILINKVAVESVIRVAVILSFLNLRREGISPVFLA